MHVTVFSMITNSVYPVCSLCLFTYSVRSWVACQTIQYCPEFQCIRKRGTISVDISVWNQEWSLIFIIWAFSTKMYYHCKFLVVRVNLPQLIKNYPFIFNTCSYIKWISIPKIYNYLAAISIHIPFILCILDYIR